MIYEQAADAERAMRRYNTVQLDGQPMEVRLCWSGWQQGGGVAGQEHRCMVAVLAAWCCLLVVLGDVQPRCHSPAAMQPTHSPPCCSCCPLPTAPQIELIAKAAGGAAGGGAGGPRTLSSGIRISGEKGGTRMVQLTRHFQQVRAGRLGKRVGVRGLQDGCCRSFGWVAAACRQSDHAGHSLSPLALPYLLAPLLPPQAAGGTGRVRGRGSVRSGRSGVAAMQE